MTDNVVPFPRLEAGSQILVELPETITIPESAVPVIREPMVRAPLVRIAKTAIEAIEEGYMQELDERDRKRASVAVVALLRLLEGYQKPEEEDA
jgi:hypothetical protein